jgi:hypothetical protein
MKSTVIASSRLWINVAVYVFLVALNDLDAVNFSIEDQEISDDAVTVTVPIKVSDFSDVGAMQFTLRWDSTVLNFKNLGDFDHSADPSELFFFSATNFNTDGVANGTLLCLYEQLFATDAVLEDNVTIFSITFDVIGGDGISTVVGFSDDPTPRKLASFLDQSPDFISQDGTIQIGSGSLSSDSTAPIITLNGAAIVNQEAGSIYADAGASATDDTDATVTVLAAGTVDVATPGTYTLTYNASDAAGNAATPVTRTVVVSDTIVPVITLVGDASVNQEAGTTYTDAGANATDSFDATVTVTKSGTVDENAPGNYTLTYNASDAAGNAATPVKRTVVVADTMAPVITLQGSAEMDVFINAPFVDPGNSVNDSFESGLKATVTGNVDTATVGVYTLSYNVSDGAGNAATEVKRTVHVVDQDGPVIILTGVGSVNHEAGTHYEDAGATATDNVDTTVSVTITSTVDTETPGTYTVIYNASDNEGNSATPVTRTVVVADTISPIITLLGDASMTIGAGDDFTDPGSSANDSFDGELTPGVTGSVNTSTPGIYTLSYNVSDSAGNAATEVTRTVNVVDQVGPVITLNGPANVQHEAGIPYKDPGATATDNLDSVPLTTTGTVDVAAPGTYILTYNASDAAGNAATPVTRTVVVADTMAPVITLQGSAEMDVFINAPFVDPGSSVNDSFESGLKATVTGNVDTARVGLYTLSYNVSDGAGNTAPEVTRTVNVVDQAAPIITLIGDAIVEHEAGTFYLDAGATAKDNKDSAARLTVSGIMDVNRPGTYTLTFNATDSDGNSATPVSREIVVADTIPPVITLLGAAEMNLMVNTPFKDQGNIVSDSFEQGLTATVTGSVDTASLGAYVLRYNVSDSSNNAAEEVTRTVHVVDHSGPILKLNGESVISHEAGADFRDPGAISMDNAGRIFEVTITGAVDENKLGTYTLTYNAKDDAGNPATEVTRDVMVIDAVAPVVTLLGEVEITHIVGTDYNDQGAQAMDNFDPSVEYELNGEVNTEELGIYKLRYDAKDLSGNVATPVERIVRVTDGLEVSLITSTSTQISENGGQSDITVYLSQPALAESTLLSVVATPASRVKVPATFPVFVGLEKIEFSIEGLDDSDTNGDELVSIQLRTAYRDLGEPIELTIQDDDLEAPVAGTVSDGLISGATVFFDRNANRVLDADEPSTQTDNRGGYQLNLPASLYDSNGDDVVDSADGVIVARGGIDTATGLTLETPLLAPPSATVINPITTLVSNMIESDSSLDADNAAALVQSSLGIGGVDVLNFDMFEEAGNENPAATEVIKAAAKVQDTIVQAGSFISGASTISKAASYSLVSEILVKKIKEQQPIELNDVATLESVVEEAAVKAQVVIAPESIKGAAAIISDSNQLKESAVDAADSVANAAQEISRVQGHAQSESQSDLADLGAGIQSLESLEIKYEAENLEKLVQETAVGPVSGVDERVGTFAFSSADYEVNESGEAVSQIKITREEGNLGVVDLLVTPQALTASSDEDFLSAVIAVRFEDQEITKTLSLEGVLIDDLISDAGESFTLQLGLKEQGDSPAKIGAIAEANIQIVDNDFAGTFQFKVVSNTFSEAETGEQYLVVERVGGNSGEVTLELSEESVAGGATSGVDYTYSQSSITFGDGVLQRKVSVNLIDDALLETDESFRLTLSLPTGDTSGALIGSNAVTEILIQSDEVDLPPVIGALNTINLPEDTPEITVTFTVKDDFTPFEDLITSVISSNPSVIPVENLVLVPIVEGGFWMLRILPPANVHGATEISVEVSDGVHVSVQEFSVVISSKNDVPSITAIPAILVAGDQEVVIPFEINDMDHSAEDLLVYLETDRMEYLNAGNVTVRGTGSNRELVINPKGGGRETGDFILVVKDDEGASSSREFTVHFGGDAPAPVVPQLGITRDGLDGLILNWEGDALLYISRDLSGVFEALPDAVSPYRLDMSGSAFFKLGLKP